MASELLKNRALIQKLKEPEVPRVKFDLASTGFEELFTLPEPKPQELLDIQEDVRIQRQQDTMDKARPFLMDESVDFIERKEFFKGSPGVVGSIQPMKSRVTGKINGYNIDFKIPGTKERADIGKTYFGIKEYGTAEAAKKAAEARYKEIIEDPKFKNLLDIQGSTQGIRRETVVKSFLNYLENNGEFDGYEKLADELKPYRYDNINRIYQLINKDFKDWKDGKFEVEGIDRKNLSAIAKQEIKNWSPKAKGERTNTRQKQLQFLDNLNNEDLPLKAVKQAFKKEFGKGKFYNEKTFGQRANQLTQLKKEGALPSNADGSKTLDYGIKIGSRAAWLKKALSESISFSNNYNRLIRASDVLEAEGKIKDAKRLSDAANKFFGKDGILTKLPGQAEHPLSVSYGGVDNLLKVDSLVKGDLNQLKKAVFDTPIKNLTGEYNKATTTSKRKNEIKTLINNRKNFMNYLTSGSFDKGIVAPVDFNFTDAKVVATANIKAIDELEDSYDFGKFVAKGDEYSKIFKQTGKEFNLITKGGFAKRTAISDKRIADILSGEKFKELGKKKLTAFQKLIRGSGANVGIDPVLATKAGFEEFVKPAAKIGLRGATGAADLLLSAGAGPIGLGVGALIETGQAMPELTRGNIKEAGRRTIIGSLLPESLVGSMRGDLLKLAETPEEKIAMQNFIDFEKDREKYESRVKNLRYLEENPFEAEGIDLSILQNKVLEQRADLEERAPKVFFKEFAQEILPTLVRRLDAQNVENLEGPLGFFFGRRGIKDREDIIQDIGAQVVKGEEPFYGQAPVQMSPEELDEIYKSGIMAMANGGRIGFADGPDDPSKRTFMKIMAGIASLPILGKFFKSANVAKKVVPLTNTTTTMPEWFPQFVEKALAKGVQTKIDADLMEVKIPELPDVKMEVRTDGKVFVEGKNAYNEPYQIEYEPPGYEVLDYETGKAVKTKGDFTASDTEYRMVGEDDYDVDGVVLNDVDEVLGGSATKLEGFAKGTGEEKYTIGQKRIDEAEALGERADENIPYKDMDPTDFADE